MDWKKVYTFVFVTITISSLFFNIQDKAFSSDAYFSPKDIKGQILRAVEASKESIDIAVLDITSNDILVALARAKERGVCVRIVIDRKRALVKGPLSIPYKNKEFAVKVSIQKGIMHNHFAIFDCKLLITGSYYWNENVSKFNCENIILTEEIKLLMKYQKEFDRLFHEGMTPGIKAVTPTAEK